MLLRNLLKEKSGSESPFQLQAAKAEHPVPSKGLGSLAGAGVPPSCVGSRLWQWLWPVEATAMLWLLQGLSGPRNGAHFTGITRCLRWEMPLHHVPAKGSCAPLFPVCKSHQPQPFLMKTPFILGL